MKLLTEVSPQKIPVTTNSHPLGKSSELLVSQDLCEILHVRLQTIEAWRLKGIGPKFVRLPGSRLIRYRRQDVIDYISSLVSVSSTTEADHVVEEVQ